MKSIVTEAANEAFAESFGETVYSSLKKAKKLGVSEEGIQSGIAGAFGVSETDAAQIYGHLVNAYSS